jgi:hypothetical protein
LGSRSPNGLQQGPHVREVRQKGRGITPRPGVVVAAVFVLPRDRLGGRLLDWEPLEALLVATLLQRLTLKGFLDLTLLSSVLLFLLLGRREASSLPSSPILRNQRLRLLDRRQILYRGLDRLSQGNQETKGLKAIKK